LWWCAFFFFFSSRRRHTRFSRDWSSDVCSSDLDETDERVCRTGCRSQGLRDGGTQGRQERPCRALRADTRGPREGSQTPAGAAQIGRASCRERVKSAVVGGRFKEKKKAQNASRE